MIEKIRKLIPYEEFDYQTLLQALQKYSRPRAKITEFLRKGWILRVKKGLYVFGADYRKAPYSKELLANLIYGPSYLSLEYALAYYGMIPEHVETLTSVSLGRSRRFITPVGVFSYQRIPSSAYAHYFNKIDIGAGRSFLMAEPEKALADKIVKDRGLSLRTQKDVEYYLLQDLRTDESSLLKLDHSRFIELAKVYRSQKIRRLGEFLNRLTKDKKLK